MASENSKVLSHVLVTGCAGFSGRALDIVAAPVATGDVRRTAADTSAASADLYWAPQVAIEDGIRAQLAWVMAGDGATAPSDARRMHSPG